MSRIVTTIEAETGQAVEGIGSVKDEINSTTQAAQAGRPAFQNLNRTFADVGKSAPGASRALSAVEQESTGVARAMGLGATQTRLVTIAVRTLTGALGPVTIAFAALAAGLTLIQARKRRAEEEAQRLADAHERAREAARRHEEGLQAFVDRTDEAIAGTRDLAQSIRETIDPVGESERRVREFAEEWEELRGTDAPTTLEEMAVAAEELGTDIEVTRDAIQELIVFQNAAVDAGESQAQMAIRFRESIMSLNLDLERNIALQEHMADVASDVDDARDRERRSLREQERAEEEARRAAAERARERQRFAEDNERAAERARQIAFGALEDEEQLRIREHRLREQGVDEIVDLRRFAMEQSIALAQAETEAEREQIEQRITDYQAVIVARERAEQEAAARQVGALRMVEDVQRELLSEEQRRQEVLRELELSGFRQSVDVERELARIRTEIASTQDEEEIERLAARLERWREFHQIRSEIAIDAERMRIEEQQRLEQRREQVARAAAQSTLNIVTAAQEGGLRAALSAIGQELAARGTALVLRSAFPPNPAGIAAGMAMVTAGTGMARRGGASVRGVEGGTTAPGAGTQEAPRPRDVNINIEQNGFGDPQRIAAAVAEAVEDSNRRGFL